ncbi:MAG TPA: hypothetical protein VNT26_14775, partial [Candidatus Sulfotelmatobacter sp.]|nr:hypothetical protein [Candidatus Sulfotelmatobacter sp.]
MPIFLSPLPRRQFLARALAAGAGLALGPKLLGANGRDSDEHSWALLSDLHLAAERSRKLRGVNLADHFGAVARE